MSDSIHVPGDENLTEHTEERRHHRTHGKFNMEPGVQESSWSDGAAWHGRELPAVSSVLIRVPTGPFTQHCWAPDLSFSHANHTPNPFSRRDLCVSVTCLKPQSLPPTLGPCFPGHVWPQVYQIYTNSQRGHNTIELFC